MSKSMRIWSVGKRRESSRTFPPPRPVPGLAIIIVRQTHDEGLGNRVCGPASDKLKYVASPHTLSGVLALTMPLHSHEGNVQKHRAPLLGGSSPSEFPRLANKAPAFATFTRIMIPRSLCKEHDNYGVKLLLMDRLLRLFAAYQCGF